MKVLDPSGKTVSAGYFQELQVHVSISNLTSEKKTEVYWFGFGKHVIFLICKLFLL